MLRRLLFLLACAATAAAAPAPAAGPSPLAGRWRIDPALSTELSPWKSLDLTLAFAGNTLRVQRDLAWGRRTFSDTMTLDLAKAENTVPIEWWADNRHLGAYLGDQKTKRVRVETLDQGRLLRISADLVLETQQGPRDVNILSDYKVSASGAVLTLTELRSTRSRPVVYVFKRLP